MTVDTRIILSGLWVALMLTYLLGDVLRIFAGLPTYPSLYDKFLIAVGLVFNAISVWYAWNWVQVGSRG